MNHTDDTRSRKALNKRGFALIFVLGFTAVLAIFTASIGAQAAFNLRTVEKRGEADSAYYAASTGTQLSLSLLREPQGDWLQTDAVIGVPGSGTAPDVLAHTYHNFPGYTGALGTNPAPDGTIVPLDHFYIISLGIADGGDGNGGSRFEMTTMGSSVKPSFPTLPQAAFGFDRLRINGTIDHFDSRATPDGPHTPVYGGGADAMTCTLPEASVGTNTVVVSDIDIGDDAMIDGHLLIKWDATPTEVNAVATAVSTEANTTDNFVNFAETNSGSANGPNAASDTTGLNGVVARCHTSRTIPSVDPNALASATAFPTGSNVTLPEGRTYYKTGNLTLSGSDSITVADTNGDGLTEDVLVLVDGDISFTNLSGPDRINGTSQPRRLKIFSLDTANTGTPTNFTMTNSEAHCLVSGKNLNVTIRDNSELWGAVMGREVTVGDYSVTPPDPSDQSMIHYDVALRDPLLVADLYDYVLSGTVLSGNVTAGQIGTANGAAAPAAAPAPGVAPAPAPAPSGCGCGCGCGGSMMLALKTIEESANMNYY